MVSPEDSTQPNEILRLKARIIEGMADVMDGLLADHEPDHLQTDCYYYPFISPTPFELPDGVLQYGEDIDYIALSFREEPADAPTSSLEVAYESDPQKTLYVSTDPNVPTEQLEHKDALVVSIPRRNDAGANESTQTIPIEPVSPQDIYHIVMGVAVGHTMSETDLT